MADMVHWARIYAKQGMHVFPLTPGSKQPLAGSSGLKDATTDLDQIDAWWMKTPDANIGLNCEKSGLFVLDVDTKAGKVGAQSLLDLIGDDFDLLLTRQSKTWSGGSHYFFTGEGRSTASVLGKDLDTRGLGGYVVLPPSRVTEHGKTGTYSWVKNDEEKPGKTLPCAPLPDLFLPPERPHGAPVEMREVVPIIEGSRNAELARIAGRYRRIGMSPSAIGAALQVDNASRCVPPLPEREVDAIAKSVGRYEPALRLEERSAAKPPPIVLNGGELMSDEDFLKKVEVEVAWQVEGIVQRGGIILLSALPKVGKSELARNLAKAVATGGEFLGRRTKQGKVLWVGIAEPESTLRKAQETMNLLGLGITWVTTRPQGPWQPWLAEAIEKTQAEFVVVDEIGRLATDMESINDYSQVTRATQPFLDLRARFGTTFALIHHNNKLGGTSGSTAWEGAVDCIMSLARTQDNVRTIQTRQRLGEDLEPTVLVRDANTGAISAPMSKALADQRQAEQGILAALAPGQQRTRQELAELGSKGSHVGRCAVDALLAAGFIEAVGSGRKGDPRFYQRSGSFPFEKTSGSEDREWSLSGVPEAFRRVPEENPTLPDPTRGYPTLPEPPEEFTGVLAYDDGMLLL